MLGEIATQRRIGRRFVVVANVFALPRLVVVVFVALAAFGGRIASQLARSLARSRIFPSVSLGLCYRENVRRVVSVVKKRFYSFRFFCVCASKNTYTYIIYINIFTHIFKD